MMMMMLLAVRRYKLISCSCLAVRRSVDWWCVQYAAMWLWCLTVRLISSFSYILSVHSFIFALFIYRNLVLINQMEGSTILASSKICLCMFCVIFVAGLVL